MTCPLHGLPTPSRPASSYGKVWNMQGSLHPTEPQEKWLLSNSVEWDWTSSQTKGIQFPHCHTVGKAENQVCITIGFYSGQLQDHCSQVLDHKLPETEWFLCDLDRSVLCMVYLHHQGQQVAMARSGICRGHSTQRASGEVITLQLCGTGSTSSLK